MVGPPAAFFAFAHKLKKKQNNMSILFTTKSKLLYS